MMSKDQKIQPTSAVKEQQTYIASGDGRIATMLHVPDEGAQEGIVLCAPFGDERKSSWRVWTQLARALAQSGYAVMRFDYRGCGESSGDFLESTLSTRLKDVSVVADYLRDTVGVDRLHFMGLRLGAILANKAGRRRKDVDTLVVMEPIVEAERYFDRMMQRKKLRQMMTQGQAEAGAEASDIIDLDGYAVRRGTLDELRQLSLESNGADNIEKILVVQVSFNENVRPNIERSMALLREAGGAEVTLEKLVLPPFWSRVDVTDTSVLDKVVCEFMSSGT